MLSFSETKSVLMNQRAGTCYHMIECGLCVFIELPGQLFM